MANEAVLIHETHIPIPFTVADNTGIEKGAMLKMADPMTASGSAGSADVFAGIAKTEKIANDGNTHLGVYRRGIFKVLGSGNIAIGDQVMMQGTANTVIKGTNAALGGRAVGVALETSTDGQTLLIELNPSACVNVLA